MHEIAIPLTTEMDVVIARDKAAATAVNLGFDQISIGQVALAVSEICQNAMRYAGGGKVFISTKNNGRILRIEVKDEGPGIPDVAKVMREGYSTTVASLGVGFAAAKRSVDWLEIQQGEHKGVTVILEKYLPLRKEEFELGAVSLADENYLVNGDAFLVKEFDGDKVFLAVIDGLGQGQVALKMANRVKKILQDHYLLPAEKLIERCHLDLQKNADEDGGVAMSIAVLAPGKLHYIGVGDTHAYLLNGTFHHLENTDGRVGSYQLRSLQPQTFSFNRELTLLLCTDGIRTNINEEELDWEQPSQLLATQIFNLYNKPYGDATVLAVKYSLLG